MRNDHDKMAWLAWNTAFLTAYAPAKASEFLALDYLLTQRPTKTAPTQTPDQQLALAMAWVGRSTTG